MAEEQPDNDVIKEIADSASKVQVKEIFWNRPLSKSDLEYMADHMPFLQLIDIANEPNIEPEVKIIKAESNWNIHYYGDAMSSSPGLFLFGGGDFSIKLEEDDEGGDGGEDGGVVNPGKGTFRNQAFLTATEMVVIAKKMGWKGIQVIDGHPLMKWATWSAAKDQGLSLYGYEPDEHAEKKRKRVKRSRAELEMVSGYTRRR